MTESDPPLYYQRHVFCCENERSEGHPRGCCKAKGGSQLRSYLKRRAKQLGLRGLRVNAAGCLGRCELGPVLVIYPEGVWYHVGSERDADEILQQHLMTGGRVPRLRLAPEDEAPPQAGAATDGFT